MTHETLTDLRLAQEKANVEEALQAYTRSIEDIGAGYAIIRHARAGRLASRCGDQAALQLLSDARGEDAPSTVFYPLLRHARLGSFIHAGAGLTGAPS